jgi:hypothetical protein
MALDFVTIAQQPQLALLAALETTTEAARLVLIARHRDFFEAGEPAHSTAAGATADQSDQDASELVEQLERLMAAIGRYRARVLHPDYAKPF